jgi:hypothetical protein
MILLASMHKIIKRLLCNRLQILKIFPVQEQSLELESNFKGASRNLLKIFSLLQGSLKFSQKYSSYDPVLLSD